MLPFYNRSLLIIFAVGIAALLLFLGYRTGLLNFFGQPEEMPFQILKEKDAPAELIKIYKENKTKESFARFDSGNATYILINMGERPTGGYGITVEKVLLINDRAEIRIRYKEPGPRDIVIQIITFPHLFLKTGLLPEKLDVVEVKTGKLLPALKL